MNFKGFEITDENIKGIVRNGGQIPGAGSETRLDIKDALSSKEIGPLLEDTITEIVIEAGAPMLVLTGLMDTVAWDGPGMQEYRMPALGTFDIERIGEAESYPEKTVQIGGSTVTATIDKWGLKVAFTDECIRYSRWDIVNITVNEVGQAFAARKEQVVAEHILGLGVPVFDNSNPGMSIKGVTGGRGADGTANGSITVDDLFDMYAQVLTMGYTADTMILHPLTWLMFVKDAELRTFAQNNGSQTIFGGWTGSAVNHSGIPAPMRTIAGGHPFANMGAPVDTSRRNPTLGDFEVGLQTAPQLPSSLPFAMRIIVTPYMPMDPVERKTDIIMCDSRVLGAIIQESALMNEGWADPERDISYMKFGERYGLLMYEEGLGVAIARNVIADTNEFSVLKGVPTYDFFVSDGAGGSVRTLPTIDPAVPVV